MRQIGHKCFGGDVKQMGHQPALLSLAADPRFVQPYPRSLIRGVLLRKIFQQTLSRIPTRVSERSCAIEQRNKMYSMLLADAPPTLKIIGVLEDRARVSRRFGCCGSCISTGRLESVQPHNHYTLLGRWFTLARFSEHDITMQDIMHEPQAILDRSHLHRNDGISI